jgi:hypothetical protein
MGFHEDLLRPKLFRFYPDSNNVDCYDVRSGTLTNFDVNGSQPFLYQVGWCFLTPTTILIAGGTLNEKPQNTTQLFNVIDNS